MVITTKELIEKYSNYSVPKMKIKREIEKGKYILIKKGMYETNKNIDGYLLSQYLCSPSYISFEYALSHYQMIPERVYTFTCATALKKHSYTYECEFGRYNYRDVPLNVFRFGVKNVISGNYSYCIASKEKALCDLLYKVPPVKNISEIRQLLFENLRIDIDEFKKIDFDDIFFLSKIYKSTNINYLEKLIKKEFYNE